MFVFKKKCVHFLVLYVKTADKRNFSTSFLNAKNKSFYNIPGPLSLPGIGTLYQYLPFIGKFSL